MATRVKVERWAGQMALRIPTRFARKHGIKIGSMIDLEHIRVVKPRRRYKLAELMAKFEPEHRHGEWNIGVPVGRETW